MASSACTSNKQSVNNHQQQQPRTFAMINPFKALVKAIFEKNNRDDERKGGHHTDDSSRQAEETERSIDSWSAGDEASDMVDPVHALLRSSLLEPSLSSDKTQQQHYEDDDFRTRSMHLSCGGRLAVDDHFFSANGTHNECTSNNAIENHMMRRQRARNEDSCSSLGDESTGEFFVQDFEEEHVR